MPQQNLSKEELNRIHDDWSLRQPYKEAWLGSGLLTVGRLRTPYFPHHGQKQIHFTPWQYHVAVWGRRGGKTVGAAGEVFEEATFPDKHIWIVAPTYVLTDKVFREVWRWIVDDELMGPYHDVVDKKSYDPKGQRFIKLKHGTIIEGKSCENPKQLLGEGLDLVVFDECAQAMREHWEQYLEPTLVDSKGRALFITTPRGYDWVYDLWNEGSKRIGQEEGWSSSKIFSADNPHLDKKFIENKRRRTDPATFAQEYEASFVAHAGAVYPEFRGNQYFPRGHLIGMEPDTPEECRITWGEIKRWTHYRIIDPGLDNPTACLWLAISPPDFKWGQVRLYYQEYQERNAVIKDNARAISSLTRFPVMDTIIDPKAAARNEETGNSTLAVYADYGIYAREAENDIDYGLEQVHLGLRRTLEDKPDGPRILFADTLRQTIVDMQIYEWDQLKSIQPKNRPDRPRAYRDHLPSCVRYGEASGLYYIPYVERDPIARNNLPAPPERKKYGRSSTGL